MTNDGGAGGETYGLTTQVTSSGMGERGIKCLLCGLVSFHPEDVDKLYCANCNHFHGNHPQLKIGDEVKVFAPGQAAARWSKPQRVGRIESVSAFENEYTVSVPGFDAFTIKFPDDRLVEWRMMFHRRPNQTPPRVLASSPTTLADLADLIEPQPAALELQSWPHKPARKLNTFVEQPIEPVKPIRRPWWRLWW